MSVVSIRFSDGPTHEWLKERANDHKVGVSTLAERLINEGLRMEAHPLVIFRGGTAGRRPVLVGGPEVADVVGTIIGGDVPTSKRRGRAADILGISGSSVDAAMAYYADFTEEVDDLMDKRARVADESEENWRRQRDLLQQ